MRRFRLARAIFGGVEMDLPEHDVIVVGAGNAATCAALSAKREA